MRPDWIFFLLLWLFPFVLPAQDVAFGVGTNKVGYYPFYRTFTESWRPALQGQYFHDLNEHASHRWSAGLQLQFFWQESLGNQLSFSPFVSYRYLTSRGFYPELRLGGGLHLLFSRRQLWKQHDSGAWEQASPVTARFSVPLQFSFGKQFGRHALQLGYQFQMLVDFNSSVGLLPLESWSLGYRYRIKQNP